MRCSPTRSLRREHWIVCSDEPTTSSCRAAPIANSSDLIALRGRSPSRPRRMTRPAIPRQVELDQRAQVP